jgi:hypothetical protein
MPETGTLEEPPELQAAIVNANNGATTLNSLVMEKLLRLFSSGREEEILGIPKKTPADASALLTKRENV